ncbi:OsmC family protein [Sphingoaurantiacus capsulatus]|uniref:OsmC family protein n=1 Tax=Sphingoaurantiacus capsulatus TaxID=1771310 RepID=A0ABV7XEN3_9SPHN
MKHVWARGTGENYLTEIEVGAHRFTADEPPALGGGDKGPAPYDLLLGSLGACTAITLRMYAERKGWNPTRIEVDLALQRDGDTARIIRQLHIEGVDDAQRARMADIAERTPVTLTLKGGIGIDTSLA